MMTAASWKCTLLICFAASPLPKQGTESKHTADGWVPLSGQPSMAVGLSAETGGMGSTPGRPPAPINK